MKEWLKNMNTKLSGFRGLIVAGFTYASIYVSSFFENLSGINGAHLKGAAIAAIPISLKLIWTDALPKLKAWWNKA